MQKNGLTKVRLKYALPMNIKVLKGVFIKSRTLIKIITKLIKMGKVWSENQNTLQNYRPLHKHLMTGLKRQIYVAIISIELKV